MRSLLVTGVAVLVLAGFVTAQHTSRTRERVVAGTCYTIYAGTGSNPPYVTVCPPVP